MNSESIKKAKKKGKPYFHGLPFQKITNYFLIKAYPL